MRAKVSECACTACAAGGGGNAHASNFGLQDSTAHKAALAALMQQHKALLEHQQQTQHKALLEQQQQGLALQQHKPVLVSEHLHTPLQDQQEHHQAPQRHQVATQQSSTSSPSPQQVISPSVMFYLCVCVCNPYE